MNRLTRTLIALLIAALPFRTLAQPGNPAVSIRSGTSNPAQCQPSSLNVFYNTNTQLMYICTATNTWTSLAAGGGSGDLSANGTGWPVTAPVSHTRALTLAPSVSEAPLTITSVSDSTFDGATIRGGAGRGAFIDRQTAASGPLVSLSLPLGDTGNYITSTLNGVEKFTVSSAGNVGLNDLTINGTCTGCGSGITNAAGNTVIPVSDGTNLIASHLTNTGGVVTSTDFLSLQPSASGTPIVTVKSAGGNASNLFDFRDSANTLLTSVDSSGNVTAPTVTAGTIGAETLTQTCAGWGLSSPVGAWSCSGNVITRTASASDLTITNAGTIVAGTTYRVTLVIIPDATAGTTTMSVGGVSLPTIASSTSVGTGTFTFFVTAKSSAAAALTVNATAALTYSTTISVVPITGGLSSDVVRPNGAGDEVLIKSFETAPIGQMTATLSASGALSAGNYSWAVTYVTAGGETTASPRTAVKTATLNQKCALSGIPLGSPNVIARNIYRTLVGGSTYYYVGQIADNTTATYTDTSSDATISGNAQMPATNTALDPVVQVGGSTYGSGTTFKTRVLFPAGTLTQPAISSAAGTGVSGLNISDTAVSIVTNSTAYISTASNGATIVTGNTVSGSGTPTAYGYRAQVLDRTTDAAETAANYLSIVTNAGATGLVTRTLPSAASGGNYTFACEDHDGIKVPSNTADQYQLPAYTSATTGYLTSTTIGATYHTVAIDATNWQVDSMIGPWSDGTATWVSGTMTYNAALASATALPMPTARVHHVSGTTDITSITTTSTAGDVPAGYTVTLIFDGVLTFTDGNNLKLAGNFVTTADDTITLVYDGTNFYETARSVN